MKRIKIIFESQIPGRFWEVERIQKMAPTPLSEFGCLIRFPDRKAHLAVKMLTQWLNDEGFQQYSIEQVD